MIKKIMSEYKSRLILTTLLSALSSIISIFLLTRINVKINITEISEIYTEAPTFLLMVLALFVISFLSQMSLAKLGSSFVYELRNALLKRIVSVKYENLEQIGGHRVLATITTDVANISVGLALLPVFAVNISTILFCLIYLSIQSMALFAFLMLGLLFSAAMSVLLMKQGRAYFVSLREQEDNMFNVFKTLVDGNKELNINENRRGFFYENQAVPSLSVVREHEIKAKFYWVLSESMISSSLFLILGILLFAGHALLVIDGRVLTGFILFTTYLISPLLFVQTAFQSLVKGRVSYKKIINLELSDDQELSHSNAPIVNEWHALVFSDVKYTYPTVGGYQFGIGPIDLTIAQGETIFICGGNGSGKSTFAKLLTGLYGIQQGVITFAGQEITGSNKQWYRNHFSSIFSDFFLFQHVLDSKGSLVDNDSIIETLKQLKLAEKVSIDGDQLSTTKLSQGQRKRLAMLIARMEDASIYLFDEWAADQDPMFRNYFYMELLPELKAKGKTLIVITHDDKYFHTADRILEFEGGIMYEKNHVNEINIIKKI